MRTSLFVLALLLTSVAQAAPTPPPEKPVPTVLGRSFGLSVTLVAPDGIQRPLADAMAWLVAFKRKPGPHRAKIETLGRWMDRSDSGGRLLFSDVKAHTGASYQVVLPFQGVSYRSAEFAYTATPKEMRVYHASQDDGAIGLRVHWTVSIGEIDLYVNQVVRVENSGMTTVDYTHSIQGLRLPTLSHMIGDRVLTHGIFPPGNLHGNPSPSTGKGRLLSEHGALVYRGPLEPGNRLFFEFSYNIPFDDATIRLGATADRPMLDAAATIRWGHKVSPKVRVESPHRAIWRKQASYTETDLLQVGDLQPGETFVMNLSHLPIQSTIPRWMAAVGGALGLWLFFLLLLGLARRQEPEPS